MARTNIAVDPYFTGQSFLFGQPLPHAAPLDRRPLLTLMAHPELLWKCRMGDDLDHAYAAMMEADHGR